MAELNSLREQNKRLQEQFQNLSNSAGRGDLDRRIQDLNQKKSDFSNTIGSRESPRAGFTQAVVGSP